MEIWLLLHMHKFALKVNTGTLQLVIACLNYSAALVA